MKYIYTSHLDGFYCANEELSMDMLYCETCGDCDMFLGTAESREEAYETIKNSPFGYCYAEEAIEEFLDEMWGGEKINEVE